MPPGSAPRALAALAEAAAVLLAALLLALVVQVAWLGAEKVVAADLPALLALQAVVFGGIALAMMRWRVRRDLSERRLGPFLALLIGLLGAAVAFGASLAIGSVQRRLGFPVTEQEWIVEAVRDRATLKRVFPFFVVLAPLAEELFFRGYLFGFLRDRAGLPIAFLFSSLLFAAIHLNLSGTLVYVTIGVVLAATYQLSGSLVAPITAHMWFNALVIAAATSGP
jgi:membrane protease YdiL (CAAX protease family)